MLTRASEAFRTFSAVANTGLVAQPGEDATRLTACLPREAKAGRNTLSHDSRLQLYLALRVASSDPFVADGIMETFDDFRAEEGCAVIWRLSCERIRLPIPP